MAEVDRPRPPAERDANCVLELRGNAERADEVAAGASGDDGELGTLGTHEPVDDVVHRPVAAHGDEQVRTVLRRRARELAEVLGLLREERSPRQAEIRGTARDLRPPPAG